jgi:hypothetical protein
VPNIRVRRALPTASLGTIVLRPYNAYGGFIKDERGVALGQADVLAFGAVSRTLVATDVTDELGRYSIATPTTGRFFTVAFHAGTMDSGTVTIDSGTVRMDRGGSIQGTSVPTLMGTDIR